MLTLLLSSLILNASTQTPAKTITTFSTPPDKRNEIILAQSQNTTNSFGYIAPKNINFPTQNQDTALLPAPPAQQTSSEQSLITNQFATVNPKDMNPLDYKNKIENTIYQSGDRLIIIQSIPLKYIKQATTPNTQPSINTFPSF